ncbi:hypothetical protein [Dysgonomonas sp. 520]|uniref:hypothetical protein n=1 Tax=Dysgonomonas sp. 520 TaxID=2302931 RepID=UPI0013CFAEAB|nr:hypothetical protein [Dysgonomonas sp. 520]NDW10479.1 hypothetical protein [Dysgonomonas sp. 520]
MIKKKVSPIISNGDNQPKKMVGLKVEWRFLGLMLKQKIIYIPSRYGVSVPSDVERLFMEILMNK